MENLGYRNADFPDGGCLKGLTFGTADAIGSTKSLVVDATSRPAVEAWRSNVVFLLANGTLFRANQASERGSTANARAETLTFPVRPTGHALPMNIALTVRRSQFIQYKFAKHCTCLGEVRRVGAKLNTDRFPPGGQLVTKQAVMH